MKKKFSTELAYILGLVCLAIGASLMIKADFGLTMIVAPAFVLQTKLHAIAPWLSLGMMEYLWQGVLLLATMLIVRRARLSYLFSFVTAVIFGYMLDGCLALTGDLPSMLALRFVYYIFGVLICSLGVSFIFRTYISPEVHELLVKEISSKFSLQSHRVKMGYDIFCTVTAVALSLIFFAELVGIGWGTVVCALINGFLIGQFSRLFDKKLEFVDVLPLRRLFER
ncbi:MAG: hypothetical protein E7467_03435 [Ruminococcaceae bacterium]|nr:hypothetical protein [Oscillospiraceae bacterium]